MLRKVFLRLSTSQTAERFITRFPPSRRMTRRFVAGDTMSEALEVVRTLNRQGLWAAIDFLGESVFERETAQAHRNEYLRLLEAIAREGLQADISLKPTALGLDIDFEFCYENLHTIAARAHQYGIRVEIDMESHPYVDPTLALYRRLREAGFDVLVALQAYLYRTEQDIRDLMPLAPRIRLVKGAYDEPPSVAFPAKADVDANFVRLMRLMFSPEAREQGVYPAIASHDEKMIAATLDEVRAQGIPADAFEFQMIYGIRTKRQLELAEQGYRMRVYVPYGTHWYPYFMRRLAERPANVIFLLKNIVRG